MPVETSEVLRTTSEAAVILEISPDSVRQYVYRGLLTPKQMIGHTYLFADAEIERFKLERRPRGNPTFLAKKAKRSLNRQKTKARVATKKAAS